MTNLKEHKISSEIIYQGRLLDVRRDEVRLPNGNSSIREWIKHPGAVCMIPCLPNKQIALIRQYRYPVQKEMIELPAGKLNENENPEYCAIRELEEETGLKGHIVRLLDAKGDPERDPRKHIVSIVYLIEADGEPEGGDDAADAKFWPIDLVLDGELPIAGDHMEILRDWLSE